MISAFFSFDLREPGRGAAEQPPHRTPHAGVPIPARILLISHIAEMQGEFANTLMIESGTDNASRVREAE